MADNAFTVTNSMRTKFNSLGKKLERGNVKQNKLLIKELLDDDDDELVEPTLLLLQSGLMLDLCRINLQKRLPTCCTKMALVPVKVQVKCVVAWSNLSLSELKAVRKQAGKNGKIVEQLFLFATRTEKDDPVLEHDEIAFVEAMELRHVANGSPLQNLVLGPGPAVDWDESGCYALVDQDGVDKAPYVAVLHKASGVKAVREKQQPYPPPLGRSLLCIQTAMPL